MAPQTNFAIGLEPKKAIEFLEHKKAVLDHVDSVERLTSARGRAARIANISSLEMTKDIYQSLVEAQQQGKSLGSWKKDLLDTLNKKGWVVGVDKGKGAVIADPQTGEYVGTPWRLNTIYRTNMQAAYSAQRYQTMRDNADNRPYWQYSAVGDSRTRPSHLSLDGRVYRYDDPFWATFYPPNGFNCRCSVIALAERDIQRRGLTVESGEGRMLDYPRHVRPGVEERTKAFKISDDRVVIADRGFDYNIGRQSYRPNLDDYPTALAHQFAKREMGGDSFKLDYQLLSKEVGKIKQTLKIKGKTDAEQFVAIRNQLSKEYKFSAGVLTPTNRTLLNSETATVWLSDDTLIKQFNSREGQHFGVAEYALLPDVINSPERIMQDNNTVYQFYKEIDGKRYVAVLKVLKKTNEIFMQSFRNANERQWKKAFGLAAK